MNGVTFGGKHSYRDWKLFLKERPVISPPDPKYTYVEIPEADGKLDFTETLSGEVRYEMRTITFTFVVIAARTRWSAVYSEILDYVHGQYMKITLDEDPDFYYLGRLTVNDWKSDKKTATIVIEGNVEPYKLELFSSLEEWEWDPFNFETGIIREYEEIEVAGSKEVVIPGRRMSVIPVFTIDSDDESGMDVVFNGRTYSLPDGESRVVNIKLVQGENTLTFSGSGTVSIEYRGGGL